MSAVSQCRPGLGTLVKVALYGDHSDTELLQLSVGAFAEIARIESIMSFHDRQSELSRINREACWRPVAVGPEMREVLDLALTLSRETGGLFDLSVGGDLVRSGKLPELGIDPDPEASWRDIHLEDGKISFARPLLLDLGGIAKGYAVDRAMATIPCDIDAVINAGGDLCMRPWQGLYAAVRVPPRVGGPVSLLRLPMQAPALATSSDEYGEGTHPIVCPIRREALTDQRSITVFASSCMVADALTKVAFLAENPGPLFRSLEARAIAVDEHQTATTICNN